MIWWFYGEINNFVQNNKLMVIKHLDMVVEFTSY